ncbi:phosphatase PAP2 family protein [Vibrio sinus]|uniref:phosphatase PAP2 family protein n=1 Tax=Vibrio sinus TaxID=2946865 RepID=UPI003D7D0F38
MKESITKYNYANGQESLTRINTRNSLVSCVSRPYSEANRAQKIAFFCVLLMNVIFALSYLYNKEITHYINPPLSYYFQSVQALVCCVVMMAFVWYCKALFPKTGKTLLLTCGFLIVFLITTWAPVLRLTPFPPIDSDLFNLDQVLGIDQNKILGFVHQYQYLVKLLALAYNSLVVQFMVLPLLLFIVFKRECGEGFIAKFALVNFLGLSTYYFFPTASPASVLDHTFLLGGQINLALEFKQIHQGITPTVEGVGLISFPSFHVIWSTLFTYTFRNTKWVFYPLLVINTFLIAATFLLGWHYFVDILGAWVVVALAIWFVDKKARYRTVTSLLLCIKGKLISRLIRLSQCWKA